MFLKRISGFSKSCWVKECNNQGIHSVRFYLCKSLENQSATYKLIYNKKKQINNYLGSKGIKNEWDENWDQKPTIPPKVIFILPLW